MHQAIFYYEIAMALVFGVLYVRSRLKPKSKDSEGAWSYTTPVIFVILATLTWTEGKHLPYINLLYAALAIVYITVMLLAIRDLRERRRSRKITVAPQPVKAKDSRIYNDWARPDPE